MRFEPSSNVPVTPAESIEWGRHLDAMLGGTPAKKHETRVLVALSMRQNLGSYTKIPTPVRPIDIESLDDETIIAAAKKALQGKKLTREDTHTVRLFGMWRNMVWLVESKNAGRLESIVWAARVFEALASEFPAHRRDLDELADFIDATWSYSVMPKVPSIRDVRLQAPVLVRDLNALPNSLRHITETGSRGGGSSPSSLGTSLSAGGWMSEFETGDTDADE